MWLRVKLKERKLTPIDFFRLKEISEVRNIPRDFFNLGKCYLLSRSRN